MINGAVEPQKIKKTRAPYAAPKVCFLDVGSATGNSTGIGADGGVIPDTLS